MSATVEISSAVSECGNLQPVNACNPEFELLVACCAGCDQAGRIRRILSDPIDWERMLELVDHHRLVPQVYRQLLPFAHEVPARILGALRARYQENARKALWFTRELVRVLDAFASQGIEALPNKGPVLAQMLYGDVAQRQFGDLDILVRPEDVLRAKAVLFDLGYKPGIGLPANQELAYVEAGYECPFDSAYGANLVELQWRILPDFYSVDFNVANLFERAGESTLAGRTTRTLSAEDLLLVLCVHAAKHVWMQLSWLCDIAQLVRSQQLDWNAIQDQARRLGIERILGLNLLLAHRLLSLALPRAFRYLREDARVSVLAGEILPVMQRGVHYDTQSVAYFSLMMRLRERRRDRALFLWRLVVTPGMSEWSAVTLPRTLRPLYRLVRLGRLARRITAGRYGV